MKKVTAKFISMLAGMTVAVLPTTIFLAGCTITQPTSVSSDNAVEPCILASIVTSSDRYDYAADTSYNDTCLEIDVACIGTPMPRLESVLLDEQTLAMHSPVSGSGDLGVVVCYARVANLYSTKTLKVITDRGTASAQCAVPPVPPWVISPTYGVQLTSKKDQVFKLEGKCKYYRLKFSGQWSSQYTPLSTVLLDTIITSSSFVLPGSLIASNQLTGLRVAVKGYNGELSFQKGSQANMTGSAYGFVYTCNTFNNSWSSQAEFTLVSANAP